MKTKILFISVLFAVLFFSCEKDNKPNAKKEGFNSTEEFLVNPSVQEAIDDSDIPIYEGEEPPVLSGTYNAVGSVIAVSANAYSMYGATLNSTFILYNQTASGKISFREEVQGATAYGSGGYIIGEDMKFSVFQESFQTGSEAGLPYGVSVTVVLIMSGTKYNSGDLRAKGISIITNANSSNPDYTVEDDAIGTWWMWEGDFTLEGEATISYEKSGYKENLYLPEKVKESIFKTIN